MRAVRIVLFFLPFAWECTYSASGVPESTGVLACLTFLPPLAVSLPFPSLLTILFPLFSVSLFLLRDLLSAPKHTSIYACRMTRNWTYDLRLITSYFANARVSILLSPRENQFVPIIRTITGTWAIFCHVSIQFNFIRGHSSVFLLLIWFLYKIYVGLRVRISYIKSLFMAQKYCRQIIARELFGNIYHS